MKKLFLIKIATLICFVRSQSIEWTLYISQRETRLSATNKNIKSLNGLEKFNNLTEINLIYGQINNIDWIQNFTNLNYLFLQNNR